MKQITLSSQNTELGRLYKNTGSNYMLSIRLALYLKTQIDSKLRSKMKIEAKSEQDKLHFKF